VDAASAMKMSQRANFQILSQSGVSAMAQANQGAQAVLNLFG
jgi:flagellin-like hook-associated protein FlgL